MVAQVLAAYRRGLYRGPLPEIPLARTLQRCSKHQGCMQSRGADPSHSEDTGDGDFPAAITAAHKPVFEPAVAFERTVAVFVRLIDSEEALPAADYVAYRSITEQPIGVAYRSVAEQPIGWDVA